MLTGISIEFPPEMAIQRPNKIITMTTALFRRGTFLLGTSRKKVLACGVLLALATPMSAIAQQQVPGCGSLENAFGPFDYRPEKYVYETTYGSHKARVRIVESAHFTIETEMLRPRASGLVVSTGADLSYTLRAFPNHHKALMTLIRLGEKENTEQPKQSIYTIDCWFRRAVAWAPDDNISRMVYSTYLSKKSRQTEALEQLEKVGRNAGSNPFTHHNVGLLYFDLKMFDKALYHAHKAQELGMTIQTLKDQLESVGQWSEPIAAVPPAQQQ